MKKDSAIKTRSQTKKTKKEEAARLRKHNDTSSDSDYDSESEKDENEEELDMHEYRKFLAKTFPSKHMNKKVNAGKKLQKVLKEDYSEQSSSTNDDESESDEEYIPKKNKSKPKEKKNKSKKVVSSEEEEDDSESEADETVEEDSEEESEEEEVVSKKKSIKSPTHKKSSKFNIIFTIGDKRSKKNNYIDDEDEDEDEWDTCSDEDYDEDEEEQVTENEDDPISSSEDEVDDDDDEKDVTESKSSSSSNKEKNKKLEKDKKVELDDSSVNVKNVNQTSSEKESDILKALKELQIKNKDKDDKLISQCIKACEEKIEVNKKSQEKKMKKYKERNGRIFKRILHDKNTMNDFDFFEKMEPNNQKKIIKEMREINKITRIEKPYRLTLLESDIPTNLKGAAMKKISSLRYMEPGSGEYYKIKNWVDTFMRLPFGNYKTLPISIEDGVEACHDFMANAQKTLNEAVYGLNDAKMQIMQLLGQLVTNPKSIGTAIAIHGPAGTGKTSIVKEGISKILNRPFAFIALGGATDSSFLEGHGYTYEGSTWGFSEIDFDLSKCLFIFSYNDESKVNPILKDRMYRIQTKGYNQKQKTVISNDYLLPRIREQVKFKNDDIIIPPDVIHYIIDNFCGKEDGVRNLKRCYEIIYTKLNLYRLMRPDSNLFEEDMSLKVEFPFTVTKIIVDKLIKGSKENISALHNLYV